MREAGHHLAIDETAKLVFAHPDPSADVAAEHQLSHVGRSLAAQAIQQLRVGRPGERQSKHRGRGHANEQGRLIDVAHRGVIIRDGG